MCPAEQCVAPAVCGVAVGYVYSDPLETWFVVFIFLRRGQRKGKNEKRKRKSEKRKMREEEGGNAERMIIRPPHIPAGGLIGNRIPARGGAPPPGVSPRAIVRRPFRPHWVPLIRAVGPVEIAQGETLGLVRRLIIRPYTAAYSTAGSVATAVLCLVCARCALMRIKSRS